MPNVRNVRTAIEGQDLVIRVQMTNEEGKLMDYGASSTGRSLIVGSTGGPMDVDADSRTFINLTVFRKRPKLKTEWGADPEKDAKRQAKMERQIAKAQGNPVPTRPIGVGGTPAEPPVCVEDEFAVPYVPEDAISEGPRAFVTTPDGREYPADLVPDAEFKRIIEEVKGRAPELPAEAAPVLEPAAAQPTPRPVEERLVLQPCYRRGFPVFTAGVARGSDRVKFMFPGESNGDAEVSFEFIAREYRDSETGRILKMYVEDGVSEGEALAMARAWFNDETLAAGA